MHKPNITLLFQLQRLFEDAKIETLYQFLAELTYQYYHHKTQAKTCFLHCKKR